MKTVIPAKAGIHRVSLRRPLAGWIPAFAGMTIEHSAGWTPASAGMTIEHSAGWIPASAGMRIEHKRQ